MRTVATEDFNRSPTNIQAPAWQTLSAAETGERLKVQVTSGLSEQEAHSRLQRFGYNRLREEEHESLLEGILEEVREPLILMLIGVGILYALLGEISDPLVIFGVILFVIAAEVFNERRAQQAIAALRRLSEPTAQQAIFHKAPAIGDIVYLNVPTVRDNNIQVDIAVWRKGSVGG